MSSTLSEIRDLPGAGIALVIDHLPTDSFARSVRPAATKALQSLVPALLRNGWDGKSQIFEGRWDFSLPDNPSTGQSRTLIPMTFRHIHKMTAQGTCALCRINEETAHERGDSISGF